MYERLGTLYIKTLEGTKVCSSVNMLGHIERPREATGSIPSCKLKFTAMLMSIELYDRREMFWHIHLTLL